VTAGDCELRGLNFSIGLRFLVRLLMGLTKPRRKILGQELAGDVEAIGKGVHRFKVGDPVFGTTGLRFGAYAEYICLPEEAPGGAVAIKPANMDYEEAAAVPTGGLEALHFLRKARNLKGRTVLILGAGGGIGTYAVQLAKYFGADVTGVDRSEKIDLMRSIGADRVIDHTREEFAPGRATYDVILDLVGKSSFSTSMRALKEDGEYLLANPSLLAMFRGVGVSLRGRKRVRFRPAVQRSEDLVFLKELIERGRIRSVIDQRYPLEQIPAAHQHLGSGVARGKVVITVAPGRAS
jgi:NADPH:quinone reductase-like Zn-dependent oxidoreductase